MRDGISESAKAVLMLASPLVRGGGRAPAKPLTAAEYGRLARWLRETGREPADLLAGADGSTLLNEIPAALDRERIGALLGRSAAADAAVARWREASIWTVTRSDPGYPPALARKLGERAPPLLHGCGSPELLRGGGLAVVGSRNAGERARAVAVQVGRLVAAARRTVVSGGARGIDRAAENAALDAGGRAVSVLPDGLERVVLDGRKRGPLEGRRLALVSPFDPAVRFKAWHALARNKLVYALGDAGLVVDCAYAKGGTWSGAVEQLKQYRSGPVYVFEQGETEDGIRGLLAKGALAWPHPGGPEGLAQLLDAARARAREGSGSGQLPLERRGA